MLGADTVSGRLSPANLDQMQQGDVALREGAETLYHPAAGAMRQEMPWPLTAGILFALLLQFPRQLTVATTLQASPNPWCPCPTCWGWWNALTSLSDLQSVHGAAMLHSRPGCRLHP